MSGHDKVKDFDYFASLEQKINYISNISTAMGIFHAGVINLHNY